MHFVVPDSANQPLTERKKDDKSSRFTYKAQRCHEHVKKSNPSANEFAVCNASLGSGAYRKRKKG